MNNPMINAYSRTQKEINRNSLTDRLASDDAIDDATDLIVSDRPTTRVDIMATSYGGTEVEDALAFKAFKTWQYRNYHRPSTTNSYQKALTDSNISPDRHEIAPDFELKLVKSIISTVRVDDKQYDFEKQRNILRAVTLMGLSSDMLSMADGLLKQPIEIEEIVRGVHDTGQKSELFFAASLASDPTIPSVKKYLDLVAKALVLPEDIKQKIISLAQDNINKII